MTFSPEHEEWRKIRLPNWGRHTYAGLMENAPDSSCANSFWDQMVSRDDDGYGEVLDDTAIVPQADPARPEMPPIDDADAEVVGAWVAQLLPGHRAVLSRRYVLWQQVDPAAVDQAILAILFLIQRNREVVRRMA